MNEELLAFFWKQQRFLIKELCTCDGEPLQVIYPGIPNRDAGPDFLYARLRIGQTLWVGNVELHVKSSDWLKHGHQHDEAYANVILHVVYEKDKETGIGISELQLKDFIDPEAISLFEVWKSSIDTIPCSVLLKETGSTISPFWLDRLLVERWEEKSQRIRALLREFHGDWETVFYIWTARYFGLRVNTLPFEWLARSIPWKLVVRYRHKRESIEGLFFGQAGFLQGTALDGYQHRLQQEYAFFRSSYSLEPLKPEIWKFLRLRPANFPCIRISQFASLFSREGHVLSMLMNEQDPSAFLQLFELKAEPYWEDHIRFGQCGKRLSGVLGKSTRVLLLGNAILPFLFVYAEEQQLPDKREQVLDAMRVLPAEQNRVLGKWHNLGVNARDMGESQALLHLHANYCEKRKCLHCHTGVALLKWREQNNRAI